MPVPQDDQPDEPQATSSNQSVDVEKSSPPPPTRRSNVSEDSARKQPREKRTSASGPDLDERSDGSKVDRELGVEGDADGVHDIDSEAGAPRVRSRASSSHSRRPDSIVPRSKQRGLFGRFTLIPELERPFEYKSHTKWAITAVVALAGGVGPLGSAIFYPALPQMTAEFQASPAVVNLSIALYMLAMAIFPLWWSSFSETFGRRNIYLISFSVFIVFSVLSAISQSIQMLIVMRLLSGGASASVQAVGAGTIADIWESRERGRAMSIFYLGPLIGPLLGPILGGVLSQAFGWQSTMWALTAYGGVLIVLLVFCLPETLPRRRSEPRPAARSGADMPNDGGAGLARTKTRESVKQNTKKAAGVLKQLIIDPLSVLLYLRFPPVAITVYYAALTFGILFALNISVQAAYSTNPYNFSQSILGCMYIPSGVGYILASLFGGRWLDSIMAREAKKAGRYDQDGNLILLPEDRMRENAWIAGTVYPASIILYGWTIQNGVFWFVPVIGQFFFGASSMLVFAAATTMLTEFMPKRSSGGVAVNNFVRNIFSCTGAVAAQPIINRIGHGWLFTILGIFSWVTGYICIWTLKKKAPAWRISMDKALNG